MLFSRKAWITAAFVPLACLIIFTDGLANLIQPKPLVWFFLDPNCGALCYRPIYDP